MDDKEINLGYAALIFAIIHEEYSLPEEAFHKIDSTSFPENHLTKYDLEDMIKLRLGTEEYSPLSWRDIGLIYGKPENIVCRKVMRYLKKRGEKLSERLILQLSITFQEKD